MLPTEKKQDVIVEFTLAEIAEILIKQQGIHEGFYNLSIQFQLAFGAVGPSPELTCPGAMIGVGGIGLSKIEQKKANKDTVDAAKINPSPELKVKAKAKAKVKTKPA